MLRAEEGALPGGEAEGAGAGLRVSAVPQLEAPGFDYGEGEELIGNFIAIEPAAAAAAAQQETGEEEEGEQEQEEQTGLRTEFSVSQGRVVRSV